MGRHKRNQEGAVSMVTVILLAIILSVITTGFIRLVINEQRQSIDVDLSARAFYAAESGITDAKRAIRAALADGSISPAEEANLESSPPSCAPAVGGDPTISTLSNIEATYTCQLIDLRPRSLDFVLQEGQTEQIALTAVSESDPNDEVSFNRVRIRWFVPERDGQPWSLRNPGDSSLLDVPDWRSGLNASPEPSWDPEPGSFPAMLRLHFFAHPDGSISHANAGALQSTFFANPVDKFNDTTAVDANFFADNGRIVEGGCQPSIGFITRQHANCGMEIEVPSGPGGPGNEANSLYLRVKALYAGTHVQITLLNGASGLNTKGGQYKIDVTGKAGDLYRRVESSITITAGANPQLLPDFTILSADDLCKDFEITNNTADYIDRCPGFVPPPPPPPPPLPAGCSAPGTYSFTWPINPTMGERAHVVDHNDESIPYDTVVLPPDPFFVPRGRYRVVLTGEDNHTTDPTPDPLQTSEVWEIALLRADGTTEFMKIGPTQDLAFTEDSRSDTFNNVRIDEDVHYMLRRHGAIQPVMDANPNSIAPRSVQFTCIGPA